MKFNAIDLVQLHSGIRGMTDSLMREIMHLSIDRSVPLSQILQMAESELLDFIPKLKPDVAVSLAASNQELASQTLEQLQNKGFTLITMFDEQYPKQYKPYIDALPPLLYVYGDVNILQKDGIGFGGSRSVSNQGLHATDKLSQYAVKALGYTVISGHAKGVDIIAHQSALAANGETILVLPEGALTFRLNNDLRAYWAEAKERIVVLTQFAPNEPWHVRNAMARNTTAICLSKAFCVIEAGDEKGGTWSAGTTALSKKIPLYVLDDPSSSDSGAGNRKLIEKGGIPIDGRHLVFPPPENNLPSFPVQEKLF